jgi:hypothetical protein
MKRRALLQLIASATAVIPLNRVRLWAQPLELTPDAVLTLHEIAPTVLPGSIGAARVRSVTVGFVAWVRGYREGAAMAHGYGHPRLQKTGPSPAATYIAQLAALDRAARGHGASFSALDLETRRSLLDAAVTSAGVRGLPNRPAGQHVIVDLMAFYFRSTEANDDCYRATIQREVCRPIQITTRKPEPLARTSEPAR